MEKNKQTLKPFLIGVLIFVTLGISIAYETLSRFGLQDNYVIICSLAIVLAAMIMQGKNFWLMGLVIIGVIAVNLPEATLLRLHIDQDILLSLVCAIILVPLIYELMLK